MITISTDVLKRVGDSLMAAGPVGQGLNENAKWLFEEMKETSYPVFMFIARIGAVKPQFADGFAFAFRLMAEQKKEDEIRELRRMSGGEIQ